MFYISWNSIWMCLKVFLRKRGDHVTILYDNLEGHVTDHMTAHSVQRYENVCCWILHLWNIQISQYTAAIGRVESVKKIKNIEWYHILCGEVLQYYKSTYNTPKGHALYENMYGNRGCGCLVLLYSSLSCLIFVLNPYCIKKKIVQYWNNLTFQKLRQRS